MAPDAPSRIADLLPFLLLLFVGTICNAMTIPFMAFFIVEGLGRDPWTISVYSALGLVLTVTANRYFARRIDAGDRVYPLVGIAGAGYLLAASALSVWPSFWAVMTLGVAGFGLSSSSVSTMFSLGGSLAARHGVERPRFNAYMRMTTSTAWMIGPAVSFLLADHFAPEAVFRAAACGAFLWLALWRLSLPKDITASATGGPASPGFPASAPRTIWAAAAFVFCLAMAHTMCFSALPLFFVREVGLPGYAPGVAFTMKTFVEIFAIASTPFLIRRFGLRRALLGTSVLAVLAILMLASVGSFPQMLMGAALEGLYYGLFASFGISYVQSFARERPASATAIYWNALMISGLVAGPLVGVIAQLHDFRTVLWVASLVAMSAFILLFVSPKPSYEAS